MRLSLIAMPLDSGDVYYAKPFRGCEYSSIKKLSAYVEQAKHDVQTIDAASLLLSIPEIVERLKFFNPDVVGFSPTLSSMKNSLKIANIIKQWSPTPKIIMGGHHVTLCPEDILSNEPVVDAIFIGEAEISLVTFLNNLENKKGVENIKGLALRKGEKIQINPPSIIVKDLDQLPNARSNVLLELLKKHPIVGTTIQSSRGCPYNCSFCTSPIFFKKCNSYRKHSYQYVINEMEMICHEFNIHLFNFTDDLFLPAGNKYLRWGIEFANELMLRHLPIAFSVMLRSDIFQPKYKFVIEKLRDAGLHQVLVGMENISLLSLKKYNKGTTISQYHSVINTLENLNIFLVPAFINFNPYLTRSDFIDNITFLNEFIHTPVLFQFTSHLMVFPGTPIIKELTNDGLLVENDLSYLNGFSYTFSDPVIRTLSYGFKSIIKKPFPSDGIVEEVQHLLAYNRAVGRLTNSEYIDLFKQIRNIHIEMANSHFSIMKTCLKFADKLDSKGVENVLYNYYVNGCQSQIVQLKAIRDNLFSKTL